MNIEVGKWYEDCMGFDVKIIHHDALLNMYCGLMYIINERQIHYITIFPDGRFSYGENKLTKEYDKPRDVVFFEQDGKKMKAYLGIEEVINEY